MDFSEYQALAQTTSGAYGDGQSIHRQALSSLALAGEVGELCNLVKKKVAHGHDIPVSEIADELGDVLWYVAEVAEAHGLALQDVAKDNIEKLRARYPKGFSSEASINREKRRG